MTKIININEIAWHEQGEGQFIADRKAVGQLAGSEALGASLYRLMPNHKAFPFHFHHNNEEAIWILEACGCLRADEKRYEIKAGDYIALPKGKAHAHQVLNTSQAPLIYLCISTMCSPDVIEYPDSKKIGFMTGSAPGAPKNKTSEKCFYHKGAQVDYFEGEK